jgi:hypothetical protein
VSRLPSSPGFHEYGVVETPIGRAAIACGGEASRCGVETAIRFGACSAAFRTYFSTAAESDDRMVRSLVGHAPPSGDRWVVECDGAGAMIRGAES